MSKSKKQDLTPRELGYFPKPSPITDLKMLPQAKNLLTSKEKEFLITVQR